MDTALPLGAGPAGGRCTSGRGWQQWGPWRGLALLRLPLCPVLEAELPWGGPRGRKVLSPCRAQTSPAPGLLGQGPLHRPPAQSTPWGTVGVGGPEVLREGRSHLAADAQRCGPLSEPCHLAAMWGPNVTQPFLAGQEAGAAPGWAPTPRESRPPSRARVEQGPHDGWMAVPKGACTVGSSVTRKLEASEVGGEVSPSPHPRPRAPLQGETLPAAPAQTRGSVSTPGTVISVGWTLLVYLL